MIRLRKQFLISYSRTPHYVVGGDTWLIKIKRTDTFNKMTSLTLGRELVVSWLFSPSNCARLRGLSSNKNNKDDNKTLFGKESKITGDRAFYIMAS